MLFSWTIVAVNFALSNTDPAEARNRAATFPIDANSRTSSSLVFYGSTLPTNGGTVLVQLEVRSPTVLSSVGTASVTLQRKLGEIIARISGGSRSVPAGKTLVLDASASTDMDSDSTTAFAFAWDCTRGCSKVLREFLLGSTENVVSIPPTMFSSGDQFSIMLTASKETGPRSDTVQVTLIVVGAEKTDIPFIQIQQLSVRRINPTMRLVLQSESKNYQDVTWTVVSGDFPPGFIIGKSADNWFVVEANSLLPGASYTFSLTASLVKGGTKGTASVTVVTNSAPTSGNCFSTPSLGVEIIDDFKLECSQWTDDDLPLSYEWDLLSATDWNTLPSALRPLLNVTAGGVLSTTLQALLDGWAAAFPGEKLGQTSISPSLLAALPRGNGASGGWIQVLSSRYERFD